MADAEDIKNAWAELESDPSVARTTPDGPLKLPPTVRAKNSIMTFLKYCVVFALAYVVFANALLFSYAFTPFIFDLSTLPAFLKSPLSPSASISIAALLLALYLAWISGKYFRWRIFVPKHFRPPSSHSRLFKCAVFLSYAFFLIALFLIIAPSVLGLVYSDMERADDADLEITVSRSNTSFAERTLDEIEQRAILDSARRGKGDGALLRAMQHVAFAHEIEKNPKNIDQWHSALKHKSQALKTIQTIMASSTIDADDLLTTSESLKNYANDGLGLVAAHKVEYDVLKKALRSLTLRDVGKRIGADFQSVQQVARIDRTKFYYHPNETLQDFATTIRGRVLSAQSPCHAYTEFVSLRQIPSQRYVLLVSPNAFGKILHDTTLVNLDTTKTKLCLENALVAALRTTAALKAFKVETGKLPLTLGELVPEYLSEMPLDPFSGRGFKYDAMKKSLYSIGPNKVDVGGSEGEAWEEMDDPTINLNF